MRRTIASGVALFWLVIASGELTLLDAQRGRAGGGGGRGAGPQTGRGAPPPGPRQPDNQETPTFRSSVTLVQIDALVTDASGNPVSDLTVDDFEIREAGELRDITTFGAVHLPPPDPDTGTPGIEPDVRSNAGPPGRTYLFALDEVAPDSALRARRMLREFIERHMGPNDLGGVALTGRGLATSGQDFTNSKARLLQAVDKFSGGFDEAQPGRPSTSSGRQLASSLRKLTEFLATMPGRKVMIYVGEGLGGLDFYAAKDYRGGALTVAEHDAHEALAAATRGNVTIYPIDPRGLTTDTIAPGSFDTSNLDARGDLAAIAGLTGGFSVVGTNNVAAAMRRLVAENSSYYTLGFGSEYTRRDGRFVRVDVRVTRPGLRVRARDGYVAPLERRRPVSEVKGDARNPLVAEALSSPVAVNDIGMRVAAASFRGKGKNASVALAIEFDASRLDLVAKGGTMSGEFELSYLATDATGKVRPGRRHNAVVSTKRQDLSSAQRWVRVLSEIELPRGRHQLRVSVGGITRAGSVVYDLDVPDFGDEALTLSQVALAVDDPGLATVRASDPIAGALPGPQVAIRDFMSHQAIALYAEAYTNGRQRTAPTITAELRDPRGQRVQTIGGLEQRSSAPLHGSAGRALAVVMALTDLPSGPYVLHVSARIDGTSHQATRDIPIRIR